MRARCYFDTNIGDHQHFYCPDEDDADRHSRRRTSPVAGVPQPPKGTAVERVDVIVRLKRRSRSDPIGRRGNFFFRTILIY